MSDEPPILSADDYTKIGQHLRAMAEAWRAQGIAVGDERVAHWRAYREHEAAVNKILGQSKEL
jgi:hypothetical protein